ncbi:thioredoxin domain-containing protein 9 isoform X1 [Choloepus didactylus]|uniref:thioredoxin domain-containing protein 9 isoform X1 n=1 Tax=Choloepus didactylus TaxID=27675 RepID=UPI00189F16DB|nr:thioredoxin domain-containing protein 9 isoform X1 [Choloepus didactylus]XP_037663400.1 thioredoxin domain-containing protein 9 isoform X1 [Choloepus didactylus]
MRRSELINASLTPAFLTDSEARTPDWDSLLPTSSHRYKGLRILPTRAVKRETQPSQQLHRKSNSRPSETLLVRPGTPKRLPLSSDRAAPAGVPSPQAGQGQVELSPGEEDPPAVEALRALPAPARPLALGPAPPTPCPGPTPREGLHEPQPGPRPHLGGTREPQSAAGAAAVPPRRWLPVFTLVFLLLPHRVSAALVVLARLSGLSRTHRAPADSGVRSAPSPPRCRLSHPALHRPAHWDRAHMVWAPSAHARRPAASAWGRSARLIERGARGRASPVGRRPGRSPRAPCQRPPRGSRVLEPGADNEAVSSVSALAPRGKPPRDRHSVQRRNLGLPSTFHPPRRGRAWALGVPEGDTKIQPQTGTAP